MNLVSIRDLTVALPPGADRAHAVGGVSLEIGANEIVCIVGESGSGKSITRRDFVRWCRSVERGAGRDAQAARS
jgi:ABC-type dipeptide/oligopeptide/nickel transport system ATPase component